MDDSNAQQPLNSVPPQEEASVEQQQKPHIPAVVSDEIPSSERNKVTHACRPDQTPTWKIWLEIAAVVLGIYFAFIYTGQLKTMNNTYTEIRDQTWSSQMSEYMACLSAKSAQLSLSEAEKGTAFSRSMALSASNQAAAEIETERAIIRVKARVPSTEEMHDLLGLPVILANEGKSAAINLTITSKAILLRKSDTLLLNDKNMSSVSSSRFDAGAQHPPKPSPENPSPVTNYVPVRDLKGKFIPTSDPDAQDFISGADHGSTRVFFYGNIQYFDFSGKHTIRFCYPIWLIQRGDYDGSSNTPNNRACAKFNDEKVDYFNATSVPTLPASESNVPQITCIEPKPEPKP